jgi:hypothetical protein
MPRLLLTVVVVRSVGNKVHRYHLIREGNSFGSTYFKPICPREFIEDTMTTFPLANFKVSKRWFHR